MTPDVIMWKKRESFLSALLQILLAAALFSGIVFFFYKRNLERKELTDMMREARTLAIEGNLSNITKALDLAQQVLARDASWKDALSFSTAQWTNLWLTHYQPGAAEKAKAFLKKLKEAQVHTDERYGAEALHILAAGDASGTLDFIETLLKKGGSGPRILYAQARAFQELGYFRKARLRFKAAMDKQWRDVSFVIPYAEAILLEGLFGAVDMCVKATNQNPTNLQAQLSLALARAQQHKHIEETQKNLEALLMRQAELSTFQRGRAFAIQGLIALIHEKPEEAITFAEKALAINPEEGWAMHAKATALVSLKNPKGAATYMELVKHHPSASVFYLEGAAKLQDAEMLDEALALLAQYANFFRGIKNETPDGKEEARLKRDDRYFLTLGDVFRAAKKYDEAMNAYDQAIAARNIRIAQATRAKGALLVELGKFDEAFNLLIDIAPPDGTGRLPKAYLELGNIFFHKRDWGQGCQNYAYALAQMKLQHAPKATMETVLLDVKKRLLKARQRAFAKAWTREATPLIQ